jgi:hypothetical protein
MINHARYTDWVDMEHNRQKARNGYGLTFWQGAVSQPFFLSIPYKKQKPAKK